MSVSVSASGRTWDEAAGPLAQGIVRRYEARWRESRPGRRPDPFEFLQHEGAEAATSGVRLALLRADLILRWEAGDPVTASWYQGRFRDIENETLVALAYEEFCQAEDAGREVNQAEFLSRYASVAGGLRRVFDIHGLMELGSVSTTAWHRPSDHAIPLPEKGQTIAGFRLVEELGRGAFARVFLAEERQLADRPVALKVSRRGSREPQTLAKLQHTHIVPIHSYRTDQATGLHLLCMPYFGRTTLAHLYSSQKDREARTGSDLLAALDRLEPRETRPISVEEPAGRREIAARSYPQAIAWWGTRLADALQHAHERGILHRDIKPSNVLVTSDGLPMLLDFNLARAGFWSDFEAEATLGGTLAYMAPEHLEALAESRPEAVGVRSDIYALGVVLYEAMGKRPFDVPKSNRSLAEWLSRAAAERRRGAPRLRTIFPEAPPAFEAVVRMCLEPEPGDRYPSAAALAEDLRAVAEDRPLLYAREPIVSRATRWTRRNRRFLMGSTAVILAVVMLSAAVISRHLAQASMEGQIVELLKIGLNAEEQLRPDRPEPIGDRYERAEGFYLAAKDIASRDPALDRLRLRATASLEQIRLKRKLRRDVESLHASADRLRFGLLGYGGDLHTVSRILSERLQPFHVLERADWHELSILSLLGSDERKEFLAEVEDLLFLWAWSLGHAVIRGEQPGLRRDALILIDNGLQITEMPDVWLELRRRLEGLPSVPGREPSRAQVVDARLAFRWALVHWHDAGGPGTASRLWLARSVTLNPTRYWSRYLLGHLYSQDPDNPAAFEHFSVAAALRGDSPWAHLAMANEYRRRFVWNRALQSSRRALSAASEWSIPLEEARLNLGLILQNLGDIRGANQSYSAVIRNAGRDSRLGIDARVNLASLRAERGDRAAALRDYDALLADHPGNRQARFGRATLREITGDPSGALEDVNALMEEREPSSELLALRAQALLRLGRWMEAELDARRAYELDPRPSRRRMLDRIAVASRRGGGPDLDDPYEVLLWPNGGPSLERDIRATADRLLEGAKGAGTEDRSLIPEAALLLASIGDRRGRELIEAFVVRAPDDAPGRVARAKIRWVGGDLAGARADLSRVLALEPEHPAALAWLGRLQVEEGQWREGLASIERAGFDNPPPWAKQARGKALMRLGRTREALEAWNSAISDDDEDPYSFLGRADAFLRLGQVDQALADFELALQHAWDRPDALVATTIQYAGILRVRPDRAQRVLEVAGRCVGLVLPRVAEGRVSRPGANANRMGQSPAGRSPAPSR